jgi:hypothetical protein
MTDLAHYIAFPLLPTALATIPLLSGLMGFVSRANILIVPDLVSRIRDVVLVRRIFSSGKPQRVGILEWGGDGEGMEMGRSVCEQPGTKVDGILSHQGGFPSK